VASAQSPGTSVCGSSNAKRSSAAATPEPRRGIAAEAFGLLFVAREEEEEAARATPSHTGGDRCAMSVAERESPRSLSHSLTIHLRASLSLSLSCC